MLTFHRAVRAWVSRNGVGTSCPLAKPGGSGRHDFVGGSFAEKVDTAGDMARERCMQAPRMASFDRRSNKRKSWQHGRRLWLRCSRERLSLCQGSTLEHTEIAENRESGGREKGRVQTSAKELRLGLPAPELAAKADLG